MITFRPEKHHFIIYTILIVLTMYNVFILYSLFLKHKYIKNIHNNIEKRQKYSNELIKEKLKNIMNNSSYIYSLDLETDNSIQKFVTSNKSFNNKGYIPENLVNIKSQFIFDTKGGRQFLRKEANQALQELGTVFYEKFDKKLPIISAYRSYNYQKGIKNRGCPDKLCAKAGFSEHQSGLAVDFWETTTNEQFMSNKIYKKYFDWLNENAQDYGFHNTYQKGLEIDGYEIEPWHWRYLGVELAIYLKENDLTIAEYYNKQKNNYGKKK